MIKLLDCTLRDGGYYNAWDFDQALIEDYLLAMNAISVDFVELGFRGFAQDGFRGGCAYTTDSFIRGLSIPDGLKIGVMVNASEIVNHPDGVEQALAKLFAPAVDSPVLLVRIPCHFYEFEATLVGCRWLKEQGYQVGINLMQIADRSLEEIEQLAHLASRYPLDVLYFADSMGSMNPGQTTEIIRALRQGWHRELGIHTHDNMGRALANSLQAVADGVTWIDGTVTGMGRGAGNVKTEYLAVELETLRSDRPCNITPLMTAIRRYFGPMQHYYGWGTNTYYYLAGKYGIHPTYIQSMLTDSRYGEEDLLAVIDHLKNSGGKKFSLNTLESARHFYVGEPMGSWSPASLIAGREVLILGTGPGVKKHQRALADYIHRYQPIVIALNTQTHLEPKLIDLRVACHPVRLLADCAEHIRLPQPLVTPVSMLPEDILAELAGKKLLDFGLAVQPDTFEFAENYCVLPTSMVIAYALAIATSGKASQILLAGFDGYSADDPRNHEMDVLLGRYVRVSKSVPITAVTPSRYQISQGSIYSLIV
ncbi:aldolase [Dolichospermum flos-aquae CCAP 1403/13F]|uniref:Aldolase n=2 Tax=Dolichospermum flosaquae TaxID=1166 RepID=A0A6H2BZN5_DOLFA|nr:aldolase [Dolichospermum flos-aquae CCAP 1403/13F]